MENLSKVEKIKNDSDYLAGKIVDQLNDKSNFFKIMKFNY